MTMKWYCGTTNVQKSFMLIARSENYTLVVSEHNTVPWLRTMQSTQAQLDATCISHRISYLSRNDIA